MQAKRKAVIIRSIVDEVRLMAVQIAVIDDWQDVAREVVDWSQLDSIGEVTFVHDYPADNATLAKRLGQYQVICVMRERTRFDEALLRAFDASGKTVEAFADMYGMPAQEARRTLERARARQTTRDA